MGESYYFIGNRDISNVLNGSLDAVSVIVVIVSDEHSDVFGFNNYSKSYSKALSNSSFILGLNLSII